MSGILLEGVSKSFGHHVVLEGLDLEVPDGSVTAVLGESGSGKTTLLRMVAGLERPDAGTIRIGGHLVDGPHCFVAPERRRIGLVPQEGALFPHLTVARNIAFGLRRREDRRSRVAELLELVGMTGMGERYPHQLSGGQQQRVALARALAPEPAVVLLDEPFSALDAGLRASLRADVVRVLRRARVTALLVTHDQEEALSTADLVGVVQHGRIRQLAAPDRLYAAPADPAVARFLGEANLLAGQAAGGRATTALGEVALEQACSGLTGAVTVLLRPEQLEVVPLAPAGAPGRVLECEYYGHDSVLVVEVPGLAEPVRVRAGGRPRAAAGEEVALAAAGPALAWPATEPRPA
ncbi:MAG TPA: ABC transporter ATP-binding protein [Acidimicrobiales bacterium]|nr:ABC transporter ATP-binding protein [Acidimicrobiales bacterium]